MRDSTKAIKGREQICEPVVKKILPTCVTWNPRNKQIVSKHCKSSWLCRSSEEMCICKNVWRAGDIQDQVTSAAAGPHGCGFGSVKTMQQGGFMWASVRSLMHWIMLGLSLMRSELNLICWNPFSGPSTVVPGLMQCRPILLKASLQQTQKSSKHWNNMCWIKAPNCWAPNPHPCWEKRVRGSGEGLFWESEQSGSGYGSEENDRYSFQFMIFQFLIWF